MPDADDLRSRATAGDRGAFDALVGPHLPKLRSIDWSRLVRDKPDLPHEVAEKLFDAAKTPQAVRQEYYRQFDLYKANQEYKAEYQEYILRLSEWTMKFGPQIRPGR